MTIPISEEEFQDTNDVSDSIWVIDGNSMFGTQVFAGSSHSPLHLHLEIVTSG
jgi:hypothetical protein